MTAYLNIGSNLGDRAAWIGRAVAEVERVLGAKARVSQPVESEPWGFDSPNRFLNAGLAVETALAPDHLLRVLQGVERALCPAPHRNADGSYADRAVDIDIIAVDSVVVRTPSLILPHARMHLREFVLLPMAELAPGWRHPLTGLTAAQMLERLRFGELGDNG